MKYMCCIPMRYVSGSNIGGVDFRVGDEVKFLHVNYNQLSKLSECVVLRGEGVFTISYDVFFKCFSFVEEND